VYKYRQYGLSPDQMAWVHKLALETLEPKEEVKAEKSEYPNILKLFQEANKNLKFPKIHLMYKGDKVKLSLAGIRSRFPGSINITDGGPYGANTWYGRIRENGVFEPSRNLSENIVNFLEELEIDPMGIAKEYGEISGSCMFCRKELTDTRSTDMGYGPVCAKNYGLPWG
jgi:hypothetical protein